MSFASVTATMLQEQFYQFKILLRELYPSEFEDSLPTSVPNRSSNTPPSQYMTLFLQTEPSSEQSSAPSRMILTQALSIITKLGHDQP